MVKLKQNNVAIKIMYKGKYHTLKQLMELPETELTLQSLRMNIRSLEKRDAHSGRCDRRDRFSDHQG